MTLKLYRPDPDGTLKPAAPDASDYRTRLRSRRWNAAPLENPEVGTTQPWIAVAAIAILSAVTFLLLVVGYVSGFWG